MKPNPKAIYLKKSAETNVANVKASINLETDMLKDTKIGHKDETKFHFQKSKSFHV